MTFQPKFKKGDSVTLSSHPEGFDIKILFHDEGFDTYAVSRHKDGIKYSDIWCVPESVIERSK